MSRNARKWSGSIMSAFSHSDAAAIAVRELTAHLPEDDYEGRHAIAARECGVSTFMVRDELLERYAFAVPCEKALVALAKLGPIVEIGAGSGYWAYLLRKRGVDVVAYDQDPTPTNDFRFAKQWTEVLRGTPHVLTRTSNRGRALFLCWPNYATNFAMRCLRFYAGDTLAYIGEGNGGCTADDAFHTELERSWTLTKEIAIPQWSGIHDRLFIYRRGAK